MSLEHIENTACIGYANDTINEMIDALTALSAQYSDLMWVDNVTIIREKADSGMTVATTEYDGITDPSDPKRIYLRQINGQYYNTSNTTILQYVSADLDNHVIQLSAHPDIEAVYLIEANAIHRDAGLSKLIFQNADDTSLNDDYIPGVNSNSYFTPTLGTTVSGDFTQGFATATLVGQVAIPKGESKRFGLYHYINNKTIYTTLVQPVCASPDTIGEAAWPYIDEVFATIKITKLQ